MVKCFLITLVAVVTSVKFVLSTGFGRCPKQEYMQDFDLAKFAGRWYEIERSFYLIEMMYSCVTIEIENISRYKLNISVISKSRWSNGLTVSEGFAVQTRKDPTLLIYKVNSKLPKLISKFLPGSGLYQIIATDYTSYAILWSCSDYFIAYTDMIWIWGRTTEFNVTTRSYVYEILEHNEMDPERLILPQENCLD